MWIQVKTLNILFRVLEELLTFMIVHCVSNLALIDNLQYCIVIEAGLHACMSHAIKQCGCTLIIRAGSQVPSPTHVCKSQLLSLKKPLIYGWISLKLESWLFYENNSWDLCWELGLAFCFTQIPTQVIGVTSKTCCHVGIHVILRT